MTRTGTPPGRSPAVLAVAGLVGGAARAALLGAAAPPALANGYLAVLTVASRAGRRRTDGGGAAAAGHRIAVLVPAHDEEPIIGSTVGSIVGQDYPAALRTVHVVADNCTDRTAEVARHHGAEVHVRDDTLAPGKGPALGWLVQRVLAEGPRPDAFVVIDADTTMLPSFLREVDAALDGPHSAWQGYYTVRDPDLSPSTAFRHAAPHPPPLHPAPRSDGAGRLDRPVRQRDGVPHRSPGPARVQRAPDRGPGAPARAAAGRRAGRLPPRSRGRGGDADDPGRRRVPERAVGSRTAPAGPAVRPRAHTAGPAARHRTPRRATSTRRWTSWCRHCRCSARSRPRPRPPRACRGWVGPARAGSGADLAWASVAALAFHVLAGLRWAGAPRATYRALLRAPQMAWWKLRLWLRVLARPDEVRWTRTQRNQP